MNRLITIIGPAPSELTFQHLVEKLQVERQRVRDALERFRLQPVKKPRVAKSKATSDEMDIKKMLKEGVITMSDVREILGKRKGA